GTGVRVSGIYPAAVDTPMLRWEAEHGGSALNFFGSVLPVQRIVEAYAKALDTGRLEVYAPYGDSLITRLGSAFPAMLPKLIPLANRVGERGRTRFLEQIRRQP
ncbi:MAG: short-chain dehydrogenase, partial [Acidimicrobiia bacterium]|nr:short-chain dehydrogenase [Acidimicrobiia bacterium]